MTYNDAGYNQYFQRDLPSLSTVSGPQLSSLDYNALAGDLSADNLVGGKFASNDGNMVLSLEEGYLSVSSGGVERLRIGSFGEGQNTGLLLKNKDGKTLVEISEQRNQISSPTGDLLVDLDNERIVASENGLPRIVLGNI